MGLVAPVVSVLPASAAADCSVDTLVNGSFEDFTLGTSPLPSTPGISVIGDWMNDWGTPEQFLFLDLDLAPQAVAGWETTNSDNLIELQRQVSGFEQDGAQSGPGYFDEYAIQPAEGNVWAELNATEDAALFQDVDLVAGMEYTWSLKHHGRVFAADAVDEMRVNIGPAGGSLDTQTDIKRFEPTNVDRYSGAPSYSDSYTNVSTIQGSLEDGWVMYEGTFVPPSSGTYTFEFQALNGWDLAVANLLDDIRFEPTECSQSGVAAELPDTGLPSAGLLLGGTLAIAAGVIALRLTRRRA